MLFRELCVLLILPSVDFTHSLNFLQVDALLLLSQQEERYLLESNVNVALQNKMEELQRNLIQVIFKFDVSFTFFFLFYETLVHDTWRKSVIA